MFQFRTILVAVLPLLVSTGIMVVGNTLLGALLPIRMDLEGISVANIGLIMALFSVGFVTGTVICPRIVETVGHIRAFAAFAAIASACALIHAIEVNPWTWALLRALTGVAVACLHTIVESWINAKAPNALRGQVLSTYMAVYYFSGAAAFPVLEAMNAGSYQLFSVVAILISLSLVPLALARVAAPPIPSAERLGPRELVDISPLGVVGAFGAGLIIGAFNALAPIFVRGVDPAPEMVARFLLVAMLGGFLLQFPVGHLSDRFDRRRVILLVALGLLGTALALALVDGASTYGLLGLAVLFGGLAYALYPICLAHANDFMDSRKLVPAAAGMLLCYGVGASVGPVAASQVMSRIGVEGLFLFIAVAAGLLAGFTVYRMFRRPTMPSREQGAFVMVPQVTATLAALDPRCETPGEQLSFDFDAVAEQPVEPPARREAAE